MRRLDAALFAMKKSAVRPAHSKVRMKSQQRFIFALVASAAVLIPTLGSTGAAVSVLVSEAAIWLPLRRAVPQRPDAEWPSPLPAPQFKVLRF